jgi:hypothetical protein
MVLYLNVSIIEKIVNGQSVFSKCEMYGNDGNITSCLYGWEFDRSVITSSIVMDVSSFE